MSKREELAKNLAQRNRVREAEYGHVIGTDGNGQAVLPDSVTGTERKKQR